MAHQHKESPGGVNSGYCSMNPHPKCDNTSSNTPSSWGWGLISEEGGGDGWDEKHPHAHDPPQPQVLVTLCELTPIRCSVGKPRISREQQQSFKLITCDVGWSRHPLRSFAPDSTRVRAMWSIPRQAQTLAFTVRTFSLVHCDEPFPANVSHGW